MITKLLTNDIYNIKGFNYKFSNEIVNYVHHLEFYDKFKVQNMACRNFIKYIIIENQKKTHTCAFCHEFYVYFFENTDNIIYLCSKCFKNYNTYISSISGVILTNQSMDINLFIQIPFCKYRNVLKRLCLYGSLNDHIDTCNRILKNSLQLLSWSDNDFKMFMKKIKKIIEQFINNEFDELTRDQNLHNTIINEFYRYNTFFLMYQTDSLIQFLNSRNSLSYLLRNVICMFTIDTWTWSKSLLCYYYDNKISTSINFHKTDVYNLAKCLDITNLKIVEHLKSTINFKLKVFMKNRFHLYKLTKFISNDLKKNGLHIDYDEIIMMLS